MLFASVPLKSTLIPPLCAKENQNPPGEVNMALPKLTFSASKMKIILISSLLPRNMTGGYLVTLNENYLQPGYIEERSEIE